MHPFSFRCRNRAALPQSPHAMDRMDTLYVQMAVRAWVWSDFGSVGRGFESLRAGQFSRLSRPVDHPWFLASDALRARQDRGRVDAGLKAVGG